ncbi:MAG: hypothetical protein RL222_1423 [Bacteroidota bacterium]
MQAFFFQNTVVYLHSVGGFATYVVNLKTKQRDGRAVECGGLENR